jgi:hypothetical protein
MIAWKRWWLVIGTLGLILAVGLTAAGCRGATYTHTVIADTEYYLDGPQQARPPDGVLSAGTLVRTMRESGAYSLVETSDKLQVYVASASLRPLK